MCKINNDNLSKSKINDVYENLAVTPDRLKRQKRKKHVQIPVHNVYYKTPVATREINEQNC